MLSKAAKNEIIEQFSAIFKANPSVLLVEYKGLSVKELEGLRSNLKGVDTNLTVVKNTLLRTAAKDTNVEQLNDLLVGPTAIAVCESDPTAAAKVFVDTAKDFPSLVIKGGVVEGTVVGVDEITALSKLPSRQEMMAQLLGALSSPMSKLVGTLSQLQSQLLYALEAVKEKKESAPEPKEEPKAEVAETKEEKAADDSGKSEEKAEAKSEPETAEEPEVEAKEEPKAQENDAEAQTQQASEAPSEDTSQEGSAEEAKEEAEEENKEES